MIVAIPTDEKSMDSGVCPSFGRAPYFLFYNTVTKECEYLDNAAVASEGGAGVRAAQVIADRGSKALLTPRCGENAQAVLTKAEVMVYKTIAGSARENLSAFAEDKLALLADFHPGFHGHGR